MFILTLLETPKRFPAEQRLDLIPASTNNGIWIEDGYGILGWGGRLEEPWSCELSCIHGHIQVAHGRYDRSPNLLDNHSGLGSDIEIRKSKHSFRLFLIPVEMKG